ncbi:T cell receptor alpha variable 12-1 [Clarias gariepinus]
MFLTEVSCTFMTSVVTDHCMGNSIDPLVTYKAVDEGGEVTLSCKYKFSSETGSDNLHWYKQGPKSEPKFLFNIYKTGLPISSMPPRMSAKVNDSIKQVDLIISPAAVSDSVLYYCALQPTVTGN